MARLLRVLVTVAALGLAAGCGAGGSTAGPRSPVTVTVTASPAKPLPGHLTFAPLTPTNTPSAAQPTPRTPRPSPRTSGPAPTDLSRYDLPGFTTPSGNIGCLFDHYAGAHVRCDRLAMDTVPEGKPADCAGDWGHSVELHVGGPGAATCTSDSIMGLQGQTDGSRVLAYGDSVRYRGIVCTSAENGLRCSTRGGHGFVLSRAAIDAG